MGIVGWKRVVGQLQRYRTLRAPTTPRAEPLRLMTCRRVPDCEATRAARRMASSLLAMAV